MQTAQIAEPQIGTASDTRLLVPVNEAAQALGISTRKAWYLIASDHLETRKIGTRTLVTMDSVRRIAENGAS